MTAQKFAVDQLVLESASVLSPAHFESFSRLCKKVVYGPDFQLLLVDCRNQLLQQQLQKHLSAVCQKAGFAESQLPLSAEIPDVFELQQRLQNLARSHSLIQLTHAAAWFNAVPDGKRWQEFNLLRENIAQSVNCKLVLWLDDTAINQMINQAPDWWAWRSGVYTFGLESILSKPPSASHHYYDRRNLTKAKVALRIAELRSWLDKYSDNEPEIAAPLAFELGDLYLQRGDVDDARYSFEQRCLPLLEKLNDYRAIAVLHGRIADIQEIRGELDSALNIRVNSELPVYEQIGDVQSMAVVLGKIADIHAVRGNFGEALAILKKQCLPLYESVGSKRGSATVYRQIADIYFTKGELDTALDIRLRNELPVFQELGDVREMAITQGRIADINQFRGEFDVALDIRVNKELPVFERLGDIQQVAVTKGKIADIMQLKGELDEALKIRVNDELPVYEKLGDIRELAVTQFKVAEIKDRKGEFDSALSMMADKCLPVFEKVGDQRGIVVCKACMANLMMKIGNPRDIVKAKELFNESLNIANKLDIAEKEYIQYLMRQYF